jgi:hypothetical protein
MACKVKVIGACAGTHVAYISRVYLSPLLPCDCPGIQVKLVETKSSIATADQVIPKMSSLGLLLLGLTASAFAATPKPPTLTFLYTANLTTTPSISIGATPLGSRGVQPITGGIFSGPRLNGRMRIPNDVYDKQETCLLMMLLIGTVTLGMDWGLVDAKGTFSPDAIYVLKTSDGATIMVTEKGHAPNVALTFETSSPQYSWINTVLGYASGGPYDGGVVLEAWQVRPPCSRLRSRNI